MEWDTFIYTYIRTMYTYIYLIIPMYMNLPTYVHTTKHACTADI